MQLELAETRKRHLIGLTPLIDVVFILLLFFMLASSFLDWRMINLSTPETKGSVAGTSHGAVMIRIAVDGQIDLNGLPIDFKDLAPGLKKFLSVTPDQKILVRPGAGVHLQPVVNVLDVIKQSGGQHVSLTR